MKAICLMVLFSSVIHLTYAQKTGLDNAKRTLIFHSGFEPSSKIVEKGDGEIIVGIDSSFSDYNHWTENPVMKHFFIQFQGGDATMRYAKIIPEPGNPENHVLKFWLQEPNVEGTKGRIQANLYGIEGLKEFYQSERIFLPDDFNTVRTFPDKIDWLTIAEFWNNITWSQSVPYRFRITLGIGKPTKAESDLYFILDAQNCDLFKDDRQKYTTIWSEINEKVKVPIGKWFTLEYYYKEGNDKTGKFYMAIQPEGEKKKVIFDVTGYTHNTEDPNPDGVTEFNPMKLYTSKGLIDYMKSNGKTFQIYWDDFQLWKDKEH